MPTLPTTGEHAGEWGDILNEYLLHEHHPDGSHNTVRILDTPQQSGYIVVSDPNAPSGIRWRQHKQIIPLTINSPAACERIVWRAPARARVTSVIACRQGGVGATINARKQGGGDHLRHDLSLSTVDSWLDGGHITNDVYNPGDTMVVAVTHVSGNPHAVTIQVEVAYE